MTYQFEAGVAVPALDQIDNIEHRHQHDWYVNVSVIARTRFLETCDRIALSQITITTNDKQFNFKVFVQSIELQLSAHLQVNHHSVNLSQTTPRYYTKASADQNSQQKALQMRIASKTSVKRLLLRSLLVCIKELLGLRFIQRIYYVYYLHYVDQVY